MSIRTGRFSAKLLATVAALSFMGSGVAIADENSDLLGDDGVAVESSALPTSNAETVVNGEESLAPSEEPSETSEVDGDVIEDEGGAGENVVPDDTFRSCISYELGISSSSVSANQMTRLTTLGCGSKDIDTLEGIQYAKNLKSLNLNDSDVVDVSALQKLRGGQLESLSWPHHSTVLPDLRNLTKLKSFRYTNNMFDINDWIRLTDISGLANNTELTEIEVEASSVSEINSLRKLTKLETLIVVGGAISDISALKNMKNLEEVNLAHHNIQDISPLSSLSKLTDLRLSYNRITSVSALKNRPRYQYLSLTGNLIKDFSPIPDSYGTFYGDEQGIFTVRANTDGSNTVVNFGSFHGVKGQNPSTACVPYYEDEIDSFYCGNPKVEIDTNGLALFTGVYETGDYFIYKDYSFSGKVKVKVSRVSTANLYKFPVEVSSVALSGASSVLTGKSIVLKATVKPSNATNKAVSWKSSNPKIATVNSKGKVTGKKAGTVTITATAKDGSKKKATKKITVIKPVKVSKVSISGSSKVAAGSRIVLKAKISPSNATNKAVTWKSSNTKIATVNAKGVVTGKKAGKTVTITVTTKDGKKKASKKITVTKAEPVQVMYRLYNRVSHEHLYTADAHERDVLRRGDWNYEGVGWVAPKKSKTPVYRLYNPGLGDHHYTTDKHEVRVLTKKHGWRNEGIGWYSDDKKRVKVYRQFNPKLRVGSHNYTADKHEYDVNNARNGWRGEGVAWYAITRK